MSKEYYRSIPFEKRLERGLRRMEGRKKARYWRNSLILAVIAVILLLVMITIAIGMGDIHRPPMGSGPGLSNITPPPPKP